MQRVLDSNCRCVGVPCACTQTAQLALIDRPTGTVLNTFEGHSNTGGYKIMSAFVHGENDGFVVSGSEDGSILFWDVLNADLTNGRPAADAVGYNDVRRDNSCFSIDRAHSGTVTGIVSHHEENVIASCSVDATVKVFAKTLEA